MIVRLGVDDSVGIFNRYISDEEVGNFFGAADVCVLPYRSGTQSGIIGISYNFDLPVIATRVGSLPQMIEPYESGMVIENADPETIRDGVLTYFDDSLYSQYKENISKYKEQHSWEGLVKVIEGIYDKFAEEREQALFDSVKLID